MSQAPADPITFEPATPRARNDGWSSARQRLFIDKLAEWGSVQLACDHVGMSPTTAYRLRAHPSAASFSKAWDLALYAAFARLSDVAMARVHFGTTETVVYKGETTGERQVFSDKLLMFMLTRLDPLRYERFKEINMINTSTIPDSNDVLIKAMMSIDAACAAAESAAHAPAVAQPPAHKDAPAKSAARENAVDRDSLATFRASTETSGATERDRAHVGKPVANRRSGSKKGVDRATLDTFQPEPEPGKRIWATIDRTADRAPAAGFGPPYANSVDRDILASFRPTEAMIRDFKVSPAERAAARHAMLAE